MKKTIFTIAVLSLLMAALVTAHGEEGFAAAEELIDSKVPCSELSEEQLELIGDYYMEQMHPGEAHEQMDAMMGGEGSESLRLMHIRMAQSFYCGEHQMMGPGMMNQMMGSNMMGGDMMDGSMPMMRQESMMQYNAPYQNNQSDSGNLVLAGVIGVLTALIYWKWQK